MSFQVVAHAAHLRRAARTGFGIDAIVGIWVKWRLDRLGSRGSAKNIFGRQKSHQVFEAVFRFRTARENVALHSAVQKKFQTRPIAKNAAAETAPIWKA
jgi:hypothetical protein